MDQFEPELFDTRTVPLTPTASQELDVGHATLTRAVVVPLESECQEPLLRVRTVPLLPTAIQKELLGQLIPDRFCVVVDVSSPHVVPLVVARTSPLVPTATHAEALQQLTPKNDVSAPERGFA
jgi:hypothetical protein